MPVKHDLSLNSNQLVVGKAGMPSSNRFLEVSQLL